MKSTPRSKRCEESVCKPYCLARPAIANGAKNAASKITSFVVSASTPLAWPPKIPAIASGPVWSAITKVFGCNFAVVPSNKTSSSPLLAKRT